MFHGLSNTTEVFDLELQQWTSFPSMSVDRVGCAAVAVGKFILVIGGHIGDDEFGVVGVFDTETQTWSTLPNRLPARRLHCVAGSGGIQVVVAGGLFSEEASTAVSLDLGEVISAPRLSEVSGNHEKETEQLEGDGNKSEPDNDQQEQLKGLLSLLRCPITNNVMVDPVVAVDGHTYERSAIADVFSQAPSDQDVRSPATGDILSDRRLTLNVNTLAMVSKFGKA